jgi:hypothetical protein
MSQAKADARQRPSSGRVENKSMIFGILQTTLFIKAMAEYVLGPRNSFLKPISSPGNIERTT